ncbi:MAG: entericidin [Sterolibacteriaceae bacterium]|nr:entericidin [Candidatus Methylophosphatis haderslevensis]
MRKIALMTIALLAIGLAGCNAVAGFGRDVEKSGAAIQRWAHR